MTAAHEAGVSLQTLKAAFAAVNGNGAGELYPKDAAMSAETDAQTDPPPPGPDTEEGGMQTDAHIPDTEEGGAQTDPPYQPSSKASKMPVKKPAKPQTRVIELKGPQPPPPGPQANEVRPQRDPSSSPEMIPASPDRLNRSRERSRERRVRDAMGRFVPKRKAQGLAPPMQQPSQ